jgi:HSP20 family protein
MTIMRRHSPLADVVTLRDAMERLFDERFSRPLWPWNGERDAAPALDLYTTEEAVVAKVALPGVKPETVDVSVTDGAVTIRGSWDEEKRRPRRVISTRSSAADPSGAASRFRRPSMLRKPPPPSRTAC